ncbi:MAG: two-component system, OmpR family, sensor histidine kinase KdpD [Acidobacteriota bacterium]|jgi:two-component system sensor histidine kinase KdpD|nr:two-component system, OmpR family, sensor histidine kinase KdpD [Acidobacteriota bacterium]
MVANPRERSGAGRRLAPWLALPFATALVTVLAHAAGANATTAGFLYLLLVLGLATWGGWAVGAVASVASMACFNFFFFPPFGTLTVHDPANWVALITFLVASTVASRLVATARRRAEEAQSRRREVEILYDLCFSLFAASQRPGILGEAAARTLQAIGAESGGLYLAGEEAPASTVGTARLEADPEILERALATREIAESGGTMYLPLHVGGTVNGVLVARGTLAPRAVLESAGRLLALAIERERLLGEAAHLEAVRESDTLKTSLLRAVSHDLRTPLTAMRLEIESLEGRLASQPDALASLGGLSLEQERLARRIDNLLSLARLEAGVARPHPEPVPPSSLFRAARENLSLILAGRPVETRVEPRCPDVWADPSLALEILVNLLENAARAGAGPLDLVAGPDPQAPDRVRLDVLDRGPGLPPAVKRMLQGARDLRRMDDPAAGDSASGGLGLQIASGLATANGGTLALLDRPGGGTIARLNLPAAPESEEVEV